jgi:hypothetical protein
VLSCASRPPEPRGFEVVLSPPPFHCDADLLAKSSARTTPFNQHINNPLSLGIALKTFQRASIYQIQYRAGLHESTVRSLKLKTKFIRVLRAAMLYSALIFRDWELNGGCSNYGAYRKMQIYQVCKTRWSRAPFSVKAAIVPALCHHSGSNFSSRHNFQARLKLNTRSRQQNLPP